MTAAEIQKIVDRELSDPQEPLSKWTEAEVRERLVKPVKKIYQDSFEKGSTLELWLVLQERPGSSLGYQVVYDEEEKEFGLAEVKGGQPVFLGYYGTLVESVESI
jgi:hypothetical protein